MARRKGWVPKPRFKATNAPSDPLLKIADEEAWDRSIKESRKSALECREEEKIRRAGTVKGTRRRAAENWAQAHGAACGGQASKVESSIGGVLRKRPKQSWGEMEKKGGLKIQFVNGKEFKHRPLGTLQGEGLGTKEEEAVR